MRILLFIALCLFFLRSVQANRIDSLHTNEEVQQFLMTEIDSYTLYADRRAVCEAYFTNGDAYRTKQLKTIVDTATFNRIIGMIHYVGAEPLSQSYLANWTHPRFIKLEIRYKNGRKKIISDEGLIGSYGLANLYDQLFELRKTQHWKKKKKSPFGL